METTGDRSAGKAFHPVALAHVGGLVVVTIWVAQVIALYVSKVVLGTVTLTLLPKACRLRLAWYSAPCSCCTCLCGH